MSGLTYVVLSGGLLALMWIFVLIVLWTIRADLFGPKVKRLPQAATPPPASPAPIAGLATAPPAPAPHTSQSGELVFLDGPLRGRRLTLRDQPITIGRDSDSGLVLHDDYVSSYHARLSPSGSGWVLEDLGSTNGTYVGGRRISGSVPLRPGIPVKIGSTVLELQS
jgi:hypothetical protein